ncbi:MAG: aminoglycoside phosphotransferase family protein [Chloroflexota bacterium]|nr:aminoglycoside phosphotransferase family protein [Chloroflexota bacterium]
MTTGKMHADEVETDAALVQRLLATQFPGWAGLPIAPVASSGTDNALYRLGAELAVRLPRIDWATPQIAKERHWLPRLAPHLPLAIPVQLAVGEPGEGYPYQWSIYRWLGGEVVSPAQVADQRQLARDLASFVAALHAIDTTGGPLAGEDSGRGVPLAERDEEVHACLAQLDGMLDIEAALAEWRAALRTPVWDAAPVWVHGDLQPGNLLAVDGRLSAVIDFGCLAVGDPACDLLPAWNYFDATTREVYRAALDVDDATWARGRGWALSVALIALPYYQHTNPVLAEQSRRTLSAVLAGRVH